MIWCSFCSSCLRLVYKPVAQNCHQRIKVFGFMQNSWQFQNFVLVTYFPWATPEHMTQRWQWKPTREGSVSLNILWNFCLDQCKQWTVLNSKRPCLEHIEELWVCMRAVHFFSFVISLPTWSCQADLRWSIISLHIRLESLSYKFHKPHCIYRSWISTSSTEDWLGQLGYNEFLWSK